MQLPNHRSMLKEMSEQRSATDKVIAILTIVLAMAGGAIMARLLFG